ncbi:hypothetical protein KQ247_14865 [Ruegeria pomeroyi]|jgi:hypothetical protein|uniref:Uncharacterized protein n=2 Tax=Ruegeria pomeroyi TaxID=89184 RepID=Q5LU38_RUEPO|nr:hypothetical protein [Ruegeria pomeroyi]AAV94515.1 hypothetical protein SPO1220 [Ruegeria pomeroyi DSS-3]NVK99293.1 hypothetical protein [Ruegeria pomeroyi]NVL01443.1 hypothetical protein [Ruegeria pomeroyi]QWV08098.1 hypothetical protein KQ247_14865 [Ruegeria pomeroyi]
MHIPDIDFRLAVALYAALLSTFVFIRSVYRRAKFVYDFDSHSSAKRLTLTAYSQSSQEVFVHKIIVVGDLVKEVDIFEFLKPFEVKVWSFDENVVNVNNVMDVKVVAAGRTRKAGRAE